MGATTEVERPSKVDVLIVGAGPAGLMMATWLSRLGVTTRIVDKRGTKVYNGQADGLHCRTMEIFDSFGFLHRAVLESNPMIELAFWNPGESGVIQRSQRVPVTLPNTSRCRAAVLHQGRIERFMIDSIAEHSDIVVERGVLPESLEFDESKAEDEAAYPIRVQLRHLTEAEATPKQVVTSANGAGIQDGLYRSNLALDDTQDLLNAAKLNEKAGSTETVEAKYMVGCDGAHSWVRNQLGFSLDGESTDYIWGVVDIVPITDFPDIRFITTIHSASSGSMLIIPRERDIVRLYIQLTTTNELGGAKIDRSDINPDVILAAARKIFAPYKIAYRYCDWWTAYQVGQRVCNQFSHHDRIFLAGDAVHTHSPKAGQGMVRNETSFRECSDIDLTDIKQNVSMGDTHNLGWKIGQVIHGLSDRSLLKTYQPERRRVAQELIDFDYRYSRLFSGRPAKDVMDEEGVDMSEFMGVFQKQNLFISGLAVDYGKSLITAKDGSSLEQGDGTDVKVPTEAAHSTPSLAANVPLGKRMPSFPVLRQCDSHPWHLQELLLADGKWRLIVFAGDIEAPEQKQRLLNVAAALEGPQSFIRRHTPATRPLDGLIDPIVVHAAPRVSQDIFALPAIFRPFHPTRGWNYGKIFVDDTMLHDPQCGLAYENYGIDRARGCALIVRPDQHVAWIGEMDDYASMDKFFAGCMRVQAEPNRDVLDAPKGWAEGHDGAKTTINGDAAH